jgi:hypothetical protein
MYMFHFCRATQYQNNPSNFVGVAQIMDGRKATGPHIPIERLVEFILRQVPLTENENDHLAHCPTCMNEMVEGARKEIEKAPSSSARSVK